MHQEAFAALLESAGLPRESFTHSIATHFDDVGMRAWRNDDGGFRSSPTRRSWSLNASSTRSTPVHSLCPQQHFAPDEALAWLDALLTEDALLIGPLWPEPGAGRWDGRRLIAVSS